MIAYVRHVLRKAVYENSDFELTEKYISIDLRYDSRSYVSFYRDEIRKRYPGNTKLQGNRITVYFGSRNHG